ARTAGLLARRLLAATAHALLAVVLALARVGLLLFSAAVVFLCAGRLVGRLVPLALGLPGRLVLVGLLLVLRFALRTSLRVGFAFAFSVPRLLLAFALFLLVRVAGALGFRLLRALAVLAAVLVLRGLAFLGLVLLVVLVACARAGLLWSLLLVFGPGFGA